MKIESNSSWNEPPTTPQVKALYRLVKPLNIDLREENMPANRAEARSLIYELRKQLKAKNSRREINKKE